MMAMNYIEIYNEQIRDLLSDSTKKAYITEDESGEVQITNIKQVSLLFIQKSGKFHRLYNFLPQGCNYKGENVD